MLGPVVPREAILWLQTGRAASVQVRYAPAGNVSPARLTPPVTTSESEDFALTLRLGELQPGTDYEYEVYVDGEAVVKPWPFRFHTGPFWKWREPAPDVTLLLGSSAYINDPPIDRPGTPYGGGL
jgi:alkaline phosphatase D